jgi:hypothetical protein
VMAAILSIARFCRPQSELHIESTWYRGTALEDLLGVPVQKVHTDRLYGGLDWLLAHKPAIERHFCWPAAPIAARRKRRCTSGSSGGWRRRCGRCRPPPRAAG